MEILQDRIEEQKKKNKDLGWIYLGELEYSDVKFIPNSSDVFPVYLYTRYSNGVYHYATSNDFSTIGTFDYWKSATPMSIIGFLKAITSHDMDFGRLEDGSHVGLNTDNFKIRLSGMTEWIGGDEKYRKGGSFKDMESRIETTKIEKIREKANNPNLQLKW